MLRLPCALLLGSLLAPLASETALHADAVDDYLAREMALRRIPGLGLALARDGEVVRVSSYGLANVETGTPVAAESVFAIASLDKQVTAAALGRRTFSASPVRWRSREWLSSRRRRPTTPGIRSASSPRWR